MTPHPVSFDVPRPDHHERIHVAIRLLVLCALAVLGASLRWTWGILYLLLPAFAAAMIASKGAARYFVDDAPRLAGVLRWLLGAFAYLALLTDALPDRDAADHVRFEVRTTGHPTESSALVRLLSSFPAVIFLCLLGVVSAVMWLSAMVLVAVNGSYPAMLHRLQVGILRFQAGLLAYHASIVEEYPLFVLDDSSHDADITADHPA